MKKSLLIYGEYPKIVKKTFRVMKAAFFCMFVFVLHSFAFDSNAQDAVVELRSENLSIEELFKEIEKQTDYLIVYSTSEINSNFNVSLSKRKAVVADLLNEALKGQNLQYKFSDNYIVLRLAQAIEEKKPGKYIEISGTVYDKNREILPCVNISVITDSSIAGTITDADGHFYLKVPDKNTVIEISYIGFKSQQIKIGDKINFDIVLEEDVTELGEVVVTGYGSQKKASIIGAIETIQPTKLQYGSTRSFSNNLAGQVAGVIAVQRTGEPGSDNSQFWIRGLSSFAGNTNPLVLVDGVERDLNNIDPAEIESFSVLKDASASAMYGVRGANGVVVITTKRGQVGAPSVNFRIEHAISTPTKLPDYIGAADWMTLRNELSDPSSLPYTQEQIDRTRNGYDPELYPDVNWIDEVTKDYAYSTRANLTVNGGSTFLRYALVASYYNEKGIIETDPSLTYDTDIKLNRYNVRANVDVDITKSTTLRINIGGYMQEHRGPFYSTNDILFNAFSRRPWEYAVRYSNGAIPHIEASGTGINNPWAMATQYGYKTNTQSQIQSLATLEQDLKMLTPGLKAKLSFSFDSYNYSWRDRSADPARYTPATGRDDDGNLIINQSHYGSESLGLGSGGDYGTKQTYMEATMTYHRLFGDVHDVDGLFLYNQQSYDNGSVQPFRKQGIAGRLSYMYDSRYIGEFNFGYNGSENFAKGQRFGFFPSVALGWLASEEPFMESTKSVIHKLKVKASYGKSGNDNIGGRRFAYITTVNSGNGYVFGENKNYTTSGYTEGEIGTNDLTWEVSWKSNVGFELGLWEALNLNVDVFHEWRSNIFMQRQTIPNLTGFISLPYGNLGKMENQGVDLSLGFQKQLNKDWSVTFNSTFTYAKNKVTEYDEPASLAGTYRSKTGGGSINTLWGLIADRLFTENDFNPDGSLKEGIPNQLVGSGNLRPGDIKYVDRNEDGVVTTEDEGYIGGTVDPRIVYGFGASVIYRNWDLNVFFQGMGDTHRIIGGGNAWLPGTGNSANIFTNYQDRWTEENPSQDVFYPRLDASPNENNYRASTWWKKDMSFLRCKTIELGYNLPKTFLSKARLKSLRVYVSCNNPFYFSKFKLWDPELNTSNGTIYPQMASVQMGLDLNF